MENTDSTIQREVVISLVTRIEGHGTVTIRLDENGKVEDAKFQVTQFRGFEKLCEGRPFYEMPSLMARICGICPVRHLLAPSKACDAILSVRIPETAQLLRELVHCGQVLQSHALSFFHLSAPDILLGMDSDPARRNVLGLIEKLRDVARDGIALRKFRQQVIEGLAKERLHPSWVVPGGVNAPLEPAARGAGARRSRDSGRDARTTSVHRAVPRRTGMSDCSAISVGWKLQAES